MKNIRKIVAAALVTFQVILTAAVGFIPASAEAGTGGQKRSYHAYKADAPITLDGKVSEGEAWDNIPWSEDVVKIKDTGVSYQSYYASFKTMWYKDDTAAHLYVLINYNDVKHAAYSSANVHFNLGVDESGTATGGFNGEKWQPGDVVAMENADTPDGSFDVSQNGVVRKSNAAGNGQVKESAYRFCTQRVSNDNPQVTIEVEYTFRTPAKAEAGKKLGFDLNVMPGYWGECAWNTPAWRGNAENLGGLILEADSASTRKTVTVQDKNMIVASSDVTADGKFTLPVADPHSTAQLVGWKDAEGKLYKPGKELTGLTANATFTAVTADFKTLDGAAVRFADPTGLRFYSQASKADFDALGAALTATGTLILPTDMLGEGALTLEALADKEESKDYLNIVNSGWLNAATAEADGYYQFSGAIVNIKTANYDRNFSAVGYFTVTYENGETANFYGGYKAANATSVKTVATKALEDLAANPDKYNATEKAILESYTK